MNAFETKMRQGGMAAIEEASRFFMRTDPVHETLREIARELDRLGISYAVAGGMALVAHGYDRTTVAVDVLVSRDGLDAAHHALTGRGYVAPFSGSKQLRNTRTGVNVEFLVAGQYPGDGNPKPVAFPAPDAAAVDIGGIHYVSLPALIELKLASGMTHPGGLRDLADVQELIRGLGLKREYADQLDPYVRTKFVELCDALASNTDAP